MAEAGPILGERDLWRRWEARQLPAGLRTRDGLAVRVLFPGLPNSGAGPDFTGALLVFEGQTAVRGDVELHLKATSWARHGHHLDPRYSRVILHVVLLDDGGPARTVDDVVVPVLALGPSLQAPAGPAPGDGAAGPCKQPGAMRLEPEAVRALAQAAGRERFLARARRWEGELAVRPLEDCVLGALLHAAGLGRNTEACALLAEALDGATLDALLATAGNEAGTVAAAVLLGMAGLLEVARAGDDLRRAWAQYRDYWLGRPLDARQWQRFRLRPANLPEVRLRLVAALLARHGLLGFLELLIALAQRTPMPSAPVLLAPLLIEGAGTGRGWALEAWTNVLLPLLAGFGHRRAQSGLAERALALYERLPGGGDNHLLARMVAIAGLPAAPRSAIEQQGLLQLWAAHCGRQACTACPLAPLARSPLPADC